MSFYLHKHCTEIQLAINGWLQIKYDGENDSSYDDAQGSIKKTHQKIKRNELSENQHIGWIQHSTVLNDAQIHMHTHRYTD